MTSKKFTDPKGTTLHLLHPRCRVNVEEDFFRRMRVGVLVKYDTYAYNPSLVLFNTKLYNKKIFFRYNYVFLIFVL